MSLASLQPISPLALPAHVPAVPSSSPLTALLGCLAACSSTLSSASSPTLYAFMALGFALQPSSSVQ